MKIAFLFSGQGAQYPGMMKEMYDVEPAAQAVFATADASLGRSISTICFKGSEDLNLTHNTQPCVLAADLAAGMVLRAHGIEPEVAAGFSLGEYAALAFTGAISMGEVFRIVQVRADAMQEKGRSLTRQATTTGSSSCRISRMLSSCLLLPLLPA